METKDNYTKLALYARIGLVLHAFILCLLILYLGRLLFIPLFFALLIALLLHPLTVLLERWLKKRIAAIVSVLLFIVFIGSVIFFFIKELLLFFKDLPKTQVEILHLIQRLQDWIFIKFNVDDVRQVNYLKQTSSGIVARMLASAGTTFVNLLEFVVLFAFFLIFTYFILVHRRLLKSFILSFFDASQQPRINTIINSTQSIINSYVLGLLTEMVIIFILILTTLLIMGVNYALLIAVVAAVFNVIPYLGIYIAAAFGMLIAITNGTSNLAIEVAITFIVVHFLDANILMPHIVGGRVKINPLITIVAVIMGKLIWGIPGMFLFIPLTAIIRIVSENVPDLKPWSILIGEEK